MDAKERVLAKYPHAIESSRNENGRRVHRIKNGLDKISENKLTIAEAWADAASRLPTERATRAHVTQHGLTGKWWVIVEDCGQSEPIGPFDTEEEAGRKMTERAGMGELYGKEAAPKSQGLCETTMTERFENKDCVCPTYKGNLGPCARFEEGSNGNCVYCDHLLSCHLVLGKRFFDEAMSKRPVPDPAPAPTGGYHSSLGDRSYHFTDKQVIAAVVGTEHLVSNLSGRLNFMTSGEKWSLYRAVAKLIQAVLLEEREDALCMELERKLRIAEARITELTQTLSQWKKTARNLHEMSSVHPPQPAPDDPAPALIYAKQDDTLVLPLGYSNVDKSEYLSGDPAPWEGTRLTEIENRWSAMGTEPWIWNNDSAPNSVDAQYRRLDGAHNEDVLRVDDLYTGYPECGQDLRIIVERPYAQAIAAAPDDIAWLIARVKEFELAQPAGGEDREFLLSLLPSLDAIERTALDYERRGKIANVRISDGIRRVSDRIIARVEIPSPPASQEKK